MKYAIYTPNDFKLVPWRNGKGVTTELIIKSLPDSDRFMWRLSAAGVVNDGEFSDFSGYDRILILTEGNGVILDYGNGRQDVLNQPLDCVSFSGDWKTSAKLINGLVKDFNVMSNRDYCSAKADVFKTTEAHRLKIESDCLLVYAADEDIHLTTNENDKVLLPVGQLFYANEPPKSVLTIEGRSVVCVQIIYRKH